MLKRLSPAGDAALRRARLIPILAGALLTAGLIGACGSSGQGRGEASDAESAVHGSGGHHGGADAHEMHAAGEPLGDPTDYSIYHLAASWTDQHGEARHLGSLAGRVQVVTMIYTHCGYACPRILIDMKRIEAELPQELRDGVGFVMVSIDPERDTPERLAEYADAIGLDPSRWTLLTAPDNSVLELAALLGVKYRRISETDFSHTNLITVLDQGGEIVHRQAGLGTPPEETVRVIERVVRGTE